MPPSSSTGDVGSRAPLTRGERKGKRNLEESDDCDGPRDSLLLFVRLCAPNVVAAGTVAAGTVDASLATGVFCALLRLIALGSASSSLMSSISTDLPCSESTDSGLASFIDWRLSDAIDMGRVSFSRLL